jgi:hypothetical protein
VDSLQRVLFPIDPVQQAISILHSLVLPLCLAFPPIAPSLLALCRNPSQQWRGPVRLVLGESLGEQKRVPPSERQQENPHGAGIAAQTAACRLTRGRAIRRSVGGPLPWLVGVWVCGSLMKKTSLDANQNHNFEKCGKVLDRHHRTSLPFRRFPPTTSPNPPHCHPLTAAGGLEVCLSSGHVEPSQQLLGWLCLRRLWLPCWSPCAGVSPAERWLPARREHQCHLRGKPPNPRFCFSPPLPGPPPDSMLSRRRGQCMLLTGSSGPMQTSPTAVLWPSAPFSKTPQTRFVLSPRP